MSFNLASIKCPGIGTNPRIYSNGVIMCQVGHNFSFIETVNSNPWSKPYIDVEECFKDASDHQNMKKQLEDKKKKR